VTRCAECGFDWETTDRDALITTIASAGPRFTDALTPFDDETVRRRPAPDVWSALEYTAHTREGIAWYDERINRALTEDRPQFAAFDFTGAADRDAYNAEVVVYALDGLTAAGDRLSGRLRDLDDASWMRFGIGSLGDERTVLVMARRAAHEVDHHLLDIARLPR
jgi:hypothetical protein